MILRQANSGAIIRGTAPGQVLVWDESSGEWFPGASGSDVHSYDFTPTIDSTNTGFPIEVEPTIPDGPTAESKIWLTLAGQALNGEDSVNVVVGGAFFDGEGDGGTDVNCSLFIATQESGSVAVPLRILWIG